MESILNFVAAAAALSIGFGIAYSSLVHTTLNRIPLILSGMSSLTGIAGVLLIVRLLDAENLPLFRAQLIITLLVTTVFIWLSIEKLQPRHRSITYVEMSLPVLAVFVFLALLSSGSITQINPDSIEYSEIGSLTVAIVSIYAGVGFWITVSHRGTLRVAFIVAAILIFLGTVVHLSPEVYNLPIGVALIAIATAYLGTVLIRSDVSHQQKTTQEELRILNSDLKQALSDLNRADNQKRDLEKNLDRTRQYRSEFISNMSHEFRTPLNSIIGYSELLNSGVYGALNEKQIDRLEKIHRNGSQLLELISDILDINTMDAGTFTLDMTAFQVDPLVRDLVEQYRPASVAKGIAIHLVIDENLPILTGDIERIRQVMQNILDNAVKFTQEGEIWLRVYDAAVRNGRSEDVTMPTVGWLSDGNWLVFEVMDTGIGIPVEYQGEIFEEFTQVDTSFTREYGGTGLGLAIAKRLVEKHNGAIWVKSTPDKGSTFFVALPAGIQNYPQGQVTGDYKSSN